MATRGQRDMTKQATMQPDAPIGGLLVPEQRKVSQRRGLRWPPVVS